MLITVQQKIFDGTVEHIKGWPFILWNILLIQWKEQQIRNRDLQGIADLIDRRILGKRTVQFDLAKHIHRNLAFFRQLF